MATETNNNTEVITEVTSEVDNTNTQHEDSNIKHVILNELTDTDTYGKYTGSTKWFNDKLGYGFITICDGEDKGKDIFVHHSGIKPLNSNYKTLRKGEYIQFNIITGLNGLQAIDVTGIKGGPLMCDYVSIRTDGQSSQLRNNVDEYHKSSPNYYDQQFGDWQPVQRKHVIRRQPMHPNVVYANQPPPPPQFGQYKPKGSVGQKTTKPSVKNTSKYNKQTRVKQNAV